jgi:hypothetical protein
LFYRCPFLGSLTLSIAAVVLGAMAPQARADGGTVRLSERIGAYRVTVFTSPAPLRAGPVDVSVLVQEAATGTPLSDVSIQVSMAPVDRPHAGMRQAASHEAATNKLYQAALFDLPVSGRWLIAVDIDGPHGPAHTHVEVEAGEPLPRWAEMWFWIALPVVPIVLFSLQQMLVRRERQRLAVK